MFYSNDFKLTEDEINSLFDEISMYHTVKKNDEVISCKINKDLTITFDQFSDFMKKCEEEENNESFGNKIEIRKSEIIQPKSQTDFEKETQAEKTKIDALKQEENFINIKIEQEKHKLKEMKEKEFNSNKKSPIKKL